MNTWEQPIWYIDDRKEWNDIIHDYFEKWFCTKLDIAYGNGTSTERIVGQLRARASSVNRVTVEQQWKKWCDDRTLFVGEHEEAGMTLVEFYKVANNQNEIGARVSLALSKCTVLILDVYLQKTADDPEVPLDQLFVMKFAKACLVANPNLNVLFITSSARDVVKRCTDFISAYGGRTSQSGSEAPRTIPDCLASACGVNLAKADQFALLPRENTTKDKATRMMEIGSERMKSIVDTNHLMSFVDRVCTCLVPIFIEALPPAPVGMDTPKASDLGALPEPCQQEGMRQAAQFYLRRPRNRLDDIVLPDVTERQIKVLLSRIRNHQLIYEDWEFSKVDPQGGCRAFSFYGQPGTGKTMCAEAIAAELNLPGVIEVNYAELESSWVGETGKNIRAAFRFADETKAMLFFDEADSILGMRLSHVTQATDHAVNTSRSVMLEEMESFSGILVFATNLPKNIDGAFVRRILMHIAVPPPDDKGRQKLWERMLRSPVPGCEELEWATVVAESNGLTGGEIRNAALNALSALAELPLVARKLQTKDVLQAIADIQQAKKEIGRYDYTNT